MMTPAEAKEKYWTKGPDDALIVLCDHIDPILIRSYGQTRSYGLEQALQGEKRGIWKIRRKTEPMVYETKVLTPADLGRGELYATKGVKKKRIAWIQDRISRGGAELSNELVVKVGQTLGYDIEVLDQDTDVNALEEAIKSADLAVVNNIFELGYHQMRVIDRMLISGSTPYIKYDHDHRELDRDMFAEKMFKHSILNIFLSPLHLERFKRELSVDGVCLPLAIDVDFFKPVQGVERKPNTAIVCNVKLHKGYATLQRYVASHPEISFTVVGKQQPIRGKNVTAAGHIPYEKMPETYSSFEYMVHMLDKWGAGERVVLEAALCGCKVIANNRVGHATWGRELVDSEDLREWLRQAPYEFWKKVEEYERKRAESSGPVQ